MAQLVATVAVAVEAACLLTLLPVVSGGGGAVELRLGELVPQVNLTLRADGVGLGAVLVASGAALIAGFERGRRPLERSGLLLCLFGTAVAGLGGNGVLLFGGVELGSVGALVLTAAVPPAAGAVRAPLSGLRYGGGLVFGIQHLAALGLLLAVARLHGQFRTSDFASLPAQALGTGFAGAWALTGVVRLLAGLGLPREPSLVSSAWAPVAAAPTGWVVLQRLDDVMGGSLPPLLAPLLTAVGVALLVGFGLVAVRRTTRPELCGRALCVAAAGWPIVGAGLGGNDGPVLAALGALALVFALSVAPGFAAPTAGPGARPRRTAAACLAVAGGLPLGMGFSVGLGLADATVARGARALPAAVALGLGATVLALATGRAVRRSLDAKAPPGPVPVRPEIAVALGAAVLAGLFPGALVTGVDRCLGLSGLRGVDAAALRGPGGGWSGGYLPIAAGLLLSSGWAALRLLESEERRPRWLRLAVAEGGHRVVPAAAAPPQLGAPLRELPVPEWLHRADRRLAALASAADRADRWLVTQPNLLTLGLAAVVLLFAYR